MRLRLPLIVGALALAIGQTSAVGQSESPEATVRAFLSLVGKGDLDEAAKLVAGNKPSSIRVPVAPSGRMSIRIDAIRTYPGEGEAVVVADLKVEQDGEEAKFSDTYLLRKQGERWLIQTVPIGGRVVPPSLLASFVGDPKISQSAKVASTRTQCLSNVKQLGLGTIMYSADYDDRFPDPSRWRTQIMPYVKNASLFKCPDDRSGALSSYRMNPRLARLTHVQIEDPANTVMIYEGDATGFAARHDGQGTVCFTDGHAKIVTRSAYSALRKNP